MSTRTPNLLVQLVLPPDPPRKSTVTGGPIMVRLEDGIRVSQNGRMLFELAYVCEGQCPAAPEPVDLANPVAFLELRLGDHGFDVPAGPGIALDKVHVGTDRDPGSFMSEVVTQHRDVEG